MRKFLMILITFLLLFTMTSCEKNIISTYNYAIISFPNGNVVEGYIERYDVYSYSNIKIRMNGVSYFTHVSNVVLIEYPVEVSRPNNSSDVINNYTVNNNNIYNGNEQTIIN